MKRVICLVLGALMLLSAAGCGAGPSEAKPAGKGVEDLMAQITARDVGYNEDHLEAGEKLSDFAVRLLQAANEAGENTLISPLSVLYALAMTANGAREETLAQMEAVLGMEIGDLNGYLCGLRKSLEGSEDGVLSMANSIWFRDAARFTPEQDFLQCNADYYGAELYRAPFDDSTLKAINSWVKDRTHGMIPEILDRIPDEAVMYLVNALAFEGEWPQPYEEYQVRDGIFTLADGTQRDAEFMYAQDGIVLRDEHAKGFMKYYKGGRFVFAALLPDEDVSVEDYVASLTGERLHSILDHPDPRPVLTAIPKFETEYDTELSGVLKAMGMTDAFDGDLADFTALGRSEEGNIYIGRVLHKTFLSMGEKGTRAGAATAVEAVAECDIESFEPEQIYLDRPFVYMLVDLRTGGPFFIGTMMDVAA